MPRDLAHLPDDLSRFCHFAARCGHRYMACGGPSSRFEERLSAIATEYGFRAEVFATPTGLFVSAYEPGTGRAITLLERVKESSMRLDELQRVERILQMVLDRKLGLTEALKKIQASVPREYPAWVVLGAAFAVGISASLTRYVDWRAAFASGLICLMAYGITTPLAKIWKVSGIFWEFFACMVTLAVSGVLSAWLHVPIEAFAIGAFVLIVPGLTLTSAVSELADHDFLSGTARMMKGFLTLLAMGSAYVLFQELVTVLHPHARESALEAISAAAPAGGIVVISNLVMLAAFSAIFQVPRKALPWAVGSGAVSLSVLALFHTGSLFALAAFLASFTVGLLSRALGAVFRLPSQVYSVPGILTLLPGMMALASFRSFAAGEDSDGMELAFRVALVAGSIVFGLFTARIFTVKNR